MLTIALSALANAQTLPVVFASQNSLLDAQVVCNSFKNAPECRDPLSSGRHLEYEVQDKMATNPRCAGVTVIRGWYEGYDNGTGDNYDATIKRDRWDLLLGFQPGATAYDWTLVQWTHGDRGRVLAGDGTPAQIAESVCVAVKGEGATIQ